MTVVVDAREDFKQAQQEAKTSIDRARAKFGKSIKEARVQDGIQQDAIAKALKLTREQIRRYERYYEDWIERHGTEPDAG